MKAAQLGITDRATILAGKLTQVFGIEFPDAMQAAIDFIKGGVTDMAKTIEDARRRVLRDAGGDLWVEQVQGFARDGQQLFATPNGSTFAARPGSARAAGGKMILDPGQIYPHLWVNNITVNALDPQTTAEAVAGAISHLSETGGL